MCFLILDDPSHLTGIIKIEFVSVLKAFLLESISNPSLISKILRLSQKPKALTSIYLKCDGKAKLSMKV